MFLIIPNILLRCITGILIHTEPWRVEKTKIFFFLSKHLINLICIIITLRNFFFIVLTLCKLKANLTTDTDLKSENQDNEIRNGHKEK